MTEQAVWRVVARGILLVFCLLLLVLRIRELQSVIVQLLLAILLAAAITPVVDRLTMARGSRRFKIGRRKRPGRLRARPGGSRRRLTHTWRIHNKQLDAGGQH
jgi:hypothetical protein